MVKSNSQTRPRSTSPSAVQDHGTEQRILDAAHTVFLQRGTAGARMQEIAAAAGVNGALLHYYFRTKARLAEAVFRRAASDLLPRIIAILASERDLPSKVRAVVETELDQLSRVPYVPAYLISELAHHPDRAQQLISQVTGQMPQQVRGAVLGTLRRQIDAGVRTGTLVRIEPEQLVVNLLALCIFPFAARPMLTALLDLDEHGFRRFIDRRRAELPQFFMRALRP